MARAHTGAAMADGLQGQQKGKLGAWGLQSIRKGGGHEAGLPAQSPGSQLVIQPVRLCRAGAQSSLHVAMVATSLPLCLVLQEPCSCGPGPARVSSPLLPGGSV